MNAFSPPAALDFSASLRPAILVFRDGRRIVWVCGAKVPASRIHAMLTHRRGAPRPGLPLAPVRFNSVELRPCRVEDLESSLLATAQELSFRL